MKNQIIKDQTVIVNCHICGEPIRVHIKRRDSRHICVRCNFKLTQPDADKTEAFANIEEVRRGLDVIYGGGEVDVLELARKLEAVKKWMSTH